MHRVLGEMADRGYDLDQLRSIAKVKFATLLYVAGYVNP
jgi:hypothetical protein